MVDRAPAVPLRSGVRSGQGLAARWGAIAACQRAACESQGHRKTGCTDKRSTASGAQDSGAVSSGH
jgi:hypothetical protein